MGDLTKREGIGWGFEEKEEEGGKEEDTERSGVEGVGEREGHAMGFTDSHQCLPFVKRHCLSLCLSACELTQ